MEPSSTAVSASAQPWYCKARKNAESAVLLIHPRAHSMLGICILGWLAGRKGLEWGTRVGTGSVRHEELTIESAHSR